MSDKMDFLETDDEAVEDAAPEEVVVEEVAPEAIEPVVEPVAEPAVVEVKDDKTVPLEAMLDTRDKWKAEKERAENLERQLAEFNKKDEVKPDVFEDPDGYRKSVLDEATAAARAVRFELSEEIATEKHGKEVLEAANAWAMEKAAQNQGFKNDILSSKNPYEFIVKEFNQNKRLTDFNDTEYEQFQAWKTAQKQVAQEEPKQQQSAPPKSLASASSAGGVEHTPTGPGQAFDNTF